MKWLEVRLNFQGSATRGTVMASASESGTFDITGGTVWASASGIEARIGRELTVKLH